MESLGGEHKHSWAAAEFPRKKNGSASYQPTPNLLTLLKKTANLWLSTGLVSIREPCFTCALPWVGAVAPNPGPGTGLWGQRGSQTDWGMYYVEDIWFVHDKEKKSHFLFPCMCLCAFIVHLFTTAMVLMSSSSVLDDLRFEWLRAPSACKWTSKNTTPISHFHVKTLSCKQDVKLDFCISTMCSFIFNSLGHLYEPTFVFHQIERSKV